MSGTSVHLQHGATLMYVSLVHSWCCFEPETSDIECILHMFKGSLIHPRWNLTAANTPNTNEPKQEPIHLPWEYDCIARCIPNWFPGGKFFLLAWKQNCPSCYLWSIALILKSLHDIFSPSHHIERQPCGIHHNKSNADWNESCEEMQLIIHGKNSNHLPSSNIESPKVMYGEAPCNHKCSSF